MNPFMKTHPARRYSRLVRDWLFATALPAAALLHIPVHADVRPAGLFQDHAVLQAGEPLPVWGQADPGERVTVTFAGHRVYLWVFNP